MTKVLNWIKTEWKDPSTHTWLVAIGAILTAWSNGAMLDTAQAVAALILSVAAIIVPTNNGKP